MDGLDYVNLEVKKLEKKVLFREVLITMSLLMRYCKVCKLNKETDF